MRSATASGAPPSRPSGPRPYALLGRLRDGPVEVGVRPVGGGAGADRAGHRVAEAGPDEARLHDHDLHAEGADLEAQRVRQRLDRVLARVVEPAAGEGQPAAHRGDVDDAARALRPHAGQHELAHAEQAEHVGLELAPGGVHGDRLHRARLAVAGVVDEHAHGALGLLHRGHRGGHGVLVRDVEGERPAALRCERAERLRAARWRRRSTRGGEAAGGGRADARRAARDENGLGGEARRTLSPTARAPAAGVSG